MKNELGTPHEGRLDACAAQQGQSHQGKHRVSEAPMTEVKDVLAVLRLDGWAEETSMERFRARGGVLSRWNRTDREAMADALTAHEDKLEMRRGLAGGRDEVSNSPKLVRRLRLRTIRRRLELELWP
jgi:hypothetical protein